MADVDAIFHCEESDQRRTHTALFCVTLRALVNTKVREFDARDEPVLFVALRTVHLVWPGALGIVEQRLEETRLRLEGHRQLLDERRDALQAVEGELSSRQEGLRQAQSTAFAAAQSLSRVRNEINAVDLLKQGNIIRLEKLSAEKVQLEEERLRLESRLQEFNLSVETFRLNVATSRGTVEERQQRLRDIQVELNQVGRQLADSRARLGPGWRRQARSRRPSGSMKSSSAISV